MFDVEIGPSPLAVRYRLHALGVRAISNAVDVTNLVMMLHGHPLHAFDLDRLDGQAIHVRRARAGEQVVTLDGETRTLVDDDLVICDGGANGGKPVALAGVMGAGNSEIGADTRRVLLECAYFEPRCVRRTARRHGLHTESSHRFERGVDPAGVAAVLAHATGSLTAHLARGAALQGAVARAGHGAAACAIPLPPRATRGLAGGELEPGPRPQGILERLGCARDGEEATWPRCGSRRPIAPICGREVDLIEEVARVIGLDCIPAVLPAIRPQAPRSPARSIGAPGCSPRELGLSEAISYGFASPATSPPSARRGHGAACRTRSARSAMRHLAAPRSARRASSSALRRARQYGEARVRLFEVGARFLARVEPERQGLCDEVPTLRRRARRSPRRGLGQGDEVADVWDAKGLAIELVEPHVTASGPRCARSATRAPRSCTRAPPRPVCVGDARVGVFGVLHPDVVDAAARPRRQARARRSRAGPRGRSARHRGARPARDRSSPRCRAPRGHPATWRSRSTRPSPPARSPSAAGGAGPLCVGVEPFDVYRGKGVADGRKSVALRVTYRDPAGARTLTDAEVDERQKQAVAATTALGATARG